MGRESGNLPGLCKKAHLSTLTMMFPSQGVPEVPASDLLRQMIKGALAAGPDGK